MSHRPLHSLVALLPTLLFLLAGTAAGPAAANLPGELSGTVKDARNRAVPRAVVEVLAGPVLRSVRTDDAGRYRLEELPPGTYEILAFKTGYAAVRKTGVRVEAGQAVTLDFRLEWANAAAGALEVLVQDASRAPLPEAQVELLVNNTPLLTGTTDEGGSAVFPGLEPGFYGLAVRRAGFRDGFTRNLRVRAGRLTAATARLAGDPRSVGRLAGQVLDADGAAVPSASVKIVRGISRKQAATGAGGQYDLKDLVPGGDYAIEVAAAGFATQTVRDLVIRPLQTTVLNITLVANIPAAGSITGTLRTETGAPAPFATVDITAGPAAGRQGIAGADGVFTFTGLEPAPAYGLVARQTGFAPAGRSGIVVEAGKTAVVNLVLRAQLVQPGTIAGTVQDAGSGQFLGDALVEIIQGPSAGLSTLTNAAGQYVFTGVVPGGGHTLRFSLGGYETASLPLITVQPGLTTTVNARLTPIQVVTGNLAGLVRAPDGVAISGARVVLTAGPSAPLQTTTGSDGRFLFRNLRAGAGYALRAEKRGFAPETRAGLTIRAGQVTTVELTLQREAEVGVLEGRVIDLAQRPIPDATVRVIDGPAFPTPVRTNTRGEFRFEALPRGIYTVEASAAAFPASRVSGISVAPRRTSRVVILLLR